VGQNWRALKHLVVETYVQQHQPIEQNLIEDFDVPKEARSDSVSLDRVSVPMEEPRDGHEQEEEEAETGDGATKRRIEVVYRMAYCATVTLHDAQGEALFTIRYGTMPQGDPMGWRTTSSPFWVSVLT